jgi:hypothetical protein
MKIVLISERSELKDHISKHFQPVGSEIIQYLSPIKAMDNLDEIDPDLVLFSASDFPKHWKPMLVVLRSIYDREHCVFVLLKGESFPVEEAAKAQHLKANGIVGEDLSDQKELARLKELVTRYKELRDVRGAKRFTPDEDDKIEFVFSHPVSRTLVTGTVGNISAKGLAFTPDHNEYIQDLADDAMIRDCSLRIGEDVVSVDVRVVRVDDQLHLAFPSLENEHKGLLVSYMLSTSSRRLAREAGGDIGFS